MQKYIAVGCVLALAGGALGNVRVIHGSPDTPAVSVFVDGGNTVGSPVTGSPVIPSLSFRQDSGYLAVPSGDYTFKVTPEADPSLVAIDAFASIDENIPVSVIAIDFLANVRPVILVDNRTTNPSVAQLRLGHFVPDAGAVNILVNGSSFLTDVEFEDVTGYFELAPGFYDIRVVDAVSNAVLQDIPGLELIANTNVSAFALGSVAAETFGVSLFVDAVPAPGTAALLGFAGLAAVRRRR